MPPRCIHFVLHGYQTILSRPKNNLRQFCLNIYNIKARLVEMSGTQRDVHVHRDRPYVLQNGNNPFESTIKPGDYVQVDATGAIGRCRGFKSTDNGTLISVKFDNGAKERYNRSELRKLPPDEIPDEI